MRRIAFRRWCLVLAFATLVLGCAHAPVPRPTADASEAAWYAYYYNELDEGRLAGPDTSVTEVEWTAYKRALDDHVNKESRFGFFANKLVWAVSWAIAILWVVTI